MDNSTSKSVGMNTEFPEHRRADDPVRWNEERYRTLFDLGPVAVYSCNASGVIQEFNRRAAELWGREPAVGDTDERFCGSFKLFRPDGSFMPHEQCPMAEVVAGILSEVRDAEVLIERPDGSRITVVVNIRPLTDQRGEVTGAINCFYDVTARKATEEALRDSDRRKNEFLAMLAHELRNPLAPIRNSIDVLRSARRGESSISLTTASPTGPGPIGPVDAAVDVLERQFGQMVRLVDDLLDAGRISSGRMVLRKQRVELSSVVHHAVEAVHPVSESRGQELTVTLPQVPVYLNADPTRLAQIVGNLLNNACKFTDHGGRIWLTVDCTEEFGADVTEEASSDLPPYVVIRVRDTGLGIAADQLPRIFDMFMQVDTALERSVTGLGIGLTLVKTLAQLHGGTVDVSSAGVGYGSEFIVRLPIMVEAARPVPPATTPEPAVTTALRILIVDDNQDAAEMLAMLLKLSGHETHIARDGLEAVEAAARLQPDVILLDIGLPSLNGYEVARRIREQQKQRGRPLLVAITGWGQDEDRRRSEEAGFDAHMVKPVDEAALGKLLVTLGARKQEVGN